MRKKRILLTLMSLVYLMMGENIYAKDNKITENSKVLIDKDNPNGIKKLEKIESNNIDITPKIIDVDVSGEFDKDSQGVDYYKKINIAIKGENLTASNFLMPEGLHWSDKTYVEIIKGEEKGYINDVASFGRQNTPDVKTSAYSINIGDSGRINYVGKTRSGVDLDLIWTVLDSDKEDWKKNSGYNSNPRVKGLAFAGEQTIPGALGNSIVVLYNEANALSLNYKIVKHGTMEEIPVVLSFITTDIDAAQGVETNLANLVEIIPPESNLKKDNDIIYDSTVGVVGLNGSKDLPKGGYLGAGFLSSFDYTFYSPAPQRSNNSYNYAIAVRYDIFGSSLQANVESQVKQTITVNYLDTSGNKIKSTENYQGIADGAYEIDVPKIEGYKAVEYSQEKDSITPIINIVYQKEVSITFNYVDKLGRKLQESKNKVYLQGEKIDEVPLEIVGYKTPEIYHSSASGNIEYDFIYEKIEGKKENIENVKEKGLDETTKPKDSQSKVESENEVKETKQTESKKQIAEKINDVGGVTSEQENLLKEREKEERRKNEFRELEEKENQRQKGLDIQRRQEQKIKNYQNSSTSSQVLFKTQTPTNYKVNRSRVQNIENYRPTVIINQGRNYVVPYVLRQQVPRVSEIQSQQSQKQEIDWFTINTGLKGKEKELFINYIRDIAENARKKQKGDFNKINHAVANAIAYSTYNNDLLQSIVNDFGGVPNSKYYQAVEDVLINTHKEKKYLIDLPHLAAPLASAERSSVSKEVIKFILGFNLKYPLDYKHMFFQQNSLLGDKLTIIDKKDEDTDKDAFILHYHPDYKNLELHERLIKYYNEENLSNKREILYSEAMKNTETLAGTHDDLVKTSAYTLGGMALIGLSIWQNRRKYSSEIKKYVQKKIGKNPVGSLKSLGERTKNYIVNKIASITANVKNMISNTTKKVVSYVGAKVIPRVFGAVRKVANIAKNKVIKPVYNRVMKPIYNNVIRPVYNYVAKPVVNIFKKVSNTFSASWNTVKNKAKTGWNTIKSKVSSGVSKAKNFFGKWLG